jgi:hypothetical protein
MARGVLVCGCANQIQSVVIRHPFPRRVVVLPLFGLAGQQSWNSALTSSWGSMQQHSFQIHAFAVARCDARDFS